MIQKEDLGDIERAVEPALTGQLTEQATELHISPIVANWAYPLAELDRQKLGVTAVRGGPGIGLG